ncbi:MAG: cyclic nucleotide-binding domain-containing protein [Ardenticatenaceae bacterium]|nr:cyclic nucleotide-binding domain-containing protein [Anaerolineales bacterium]MCB8982597.1 cyclic nucleotide-binding domain-containing protein [Ardenticatenaceae bacterium]
MQPSISAILAVTDIFDNFTATQLELVAAICEPGTYQQGDVLLKEYESSNALYIIARGSVEILVSPDVVGSELQPGLESVKLAELRQGQVTGEVALVDQGTRSATVRVSQNDTYLLKVARHRLMLLCDTYPELGYKLMRNLAADLAFKIRNTDLTVRQMQFMLSQSKKSES